MGEKTKIAWCDTVLPDGRIIAGATWNWHWGCTRVSPGCSACYAATESKRYGFDVWDNGKYRELSEHNWNDPYRWNRKAERDGYKLKVFCGSMMDWADANIPVEWRARAWGIIKNTPNLIYLMLTKRAENIEKFLPQDWGSGYPNVWLGVTVENQRFLYRKDILGGIPATKHLVSYEPALTDVEWECPNFDWLIIGGESGANARPFDPAWGRNSIRQCRERGIVPFVKQMGTVYAKAHGLKDSKGADPSEWDEDLRIREFPE